MKHPWRPPAFSRDKTSDKSGRSEWLKFVCNTHLEWLMDMVDRVQRGEPLSDEDTEQYSVIREQAETIMAQAGAESWTEEERRECMVDAWWKADHATS